MTKDDEISGKNGMPEQAPTRQIDFKQVERLIASLEQDLGKLRGDSPSIQHLRDEVAALKAMINAPERPHHRVTDALHGIRESVDEALDSALMEGIQVGRYVAEIGRMLGM